MEEDHPDVVRKPAPEQVELDRTAGEALDTVETARQNQSLRAFTEDGGVDGQALGLAGLGWDDFPRVESAACICGHAAEGCACIVVGWMKHGDDITGGDDVSAGP